MNQTLLNTHVEPYAGCPRLVIPVWAQGGSFYFSTGVRQPGVPLIAMEMRYKNARKSVPTRDLTRIVFSTPPKLLSKRRRHEQE